MRAHARSQRSIFDQLERFSSCHNSLTQLPTSCPLSNGSSSPELSHTIPFSRIRRCLRFPIPHLNVYRSMMMLQMMMLAMFAAMLAPVRGGNIEAPIRFDNDAFVDNNHSQGSLVFSLGNVSQSTTSISIPVHDRAPPHAASDRRRRDHRECVTTGHERTNCGKHSFLRVSCLACFMYAS
jgi:hypothetical protein